MSSDKIIPVDEPRDNVYNLICHILFEKPGKYKYTPNLRHSALYVIVNQSSIGHPLSTKQIYDSLEDGCRAYFIEKSLMPIVSYLQRELQRYIGRSHIRFGAERNAARQETYFFRINKAPETEAVRTDAEIIQRLFLEVLNETKQELEPIPQISAFTYEPVNGISLAAEY